jgi:hypothetical protein
MFGPKGGVPSNAKVRPSSKLDKPRFPGSFRRMLISFRKFQRDVNKFQRDVNKYQTDVIQFCADIRRKRPPMAKTSSLH